MGSMRSRCWTLSRVLRTVNAAIDRVRVELNGSYAYDRLRELAAYEQRAGSRSWSALLAVLTPLPCFAVLLLIDALPLAPVDVGVAQQTLSFWFRTALTGASMTAHTIVTMAHSVPALPMSTMRLWTISTSIGVMLSFAGYLLALLFGFPVPFVLQLLTPLWVTLTVTLLYGSWRHIIRRNEHVRRDVVRVLRTIHALTAVIVVYTAFSCLFHLFDGGVQTFIACLFPFIKLAFKNWVDAGLHHSPHLKPLFSVFNVDIFHTMFVASAMQQTASGTALIAVLVIDFTQSVIAVLEVVSVVRIVQRTQAATREARSRQCADDALQRRRTALETTLGPLAYALHILETSERVRQDVETHRQAAAAGLAQHPVQIVPGRFRRSTADYKVPKSPRTRDPEVVTAEAVLKILYMTEFYVLTEYVEAIVAVNYGVYLYALSYLPNRVYYTQLVALSAEQLRVKAEHVLMYAAFELLSLAVFCVVVDRVMDHFSLIGQLGFVLEKHWRLVQTLFIIWVLFVVQSTLQHLGTDYTFEFKWL